MMILGMNQTTGGHTHTSCYSYKMKAEWLLLHLAKFKANGFSLCILSYTYKLVKALQEVKSAIKIYTYTHEQKSHSL